MKILFSILVFIVSAMAQNTNEWPILHNIGHTNFSPTTLLKPPLKVKWVTKVQGKFWVGPVVAEGRLVAQDQCGYLFCLDAETGELIWRYYVNGQGFDIVAYNNAPSIFNGRVYASFPSAYWAGINGMYCFNLQTGDLLWKQPSGIDPDYMGHSPQVSQGRLFNNSNVDINRNSYPNPRTFKCQVQCWDAATGDSLWTYTLWDTACTMTSLLVIGDTVFASAGYRPTTSGGATQGKTVALGLDGREIWNSVQYYCFNKFQQLQYRAGELWVKTNSTCYPCHDTLSVLNAADGTLKRKVAEEMQIPTMILAGDHYYPRIYGGTIFGHHSGTGALTMESRLFPGDAFNSGCGPAIMGNGYFFAGWGSVLDENHQGNKWYAWDSTGNPVWQYATSTNNCAQPAIAYDKLYTVTSSSSLIYCFENAQ